MVAWSGVAHYCCGLLRSVSGMELEMEELVEVTVLMEGLMP